MSETTASPPAHGPGPFTDPDADPDADPGAGAMIRKISIIDLRPGMYIVDSGLSWLEHPFLYSEEGQVDSVERIRRITAEGYLEVFVDPARGAHADGRTGRDGDAELNLHVGGPDGFAKPESRWSVPLAEEAGQARAVYRDSIQCARGFLHDAQAGNPIDISGAQECVLGVIGSVGRNADALTSLSRLRSFDEYTFTHSVNVAVLSVVFGTYLGLDSKRLKRLGVSALFHDLGKARIPAEVLNKPGRLSEREFEIVKRHPREGYEILSRNGVTDKDVLLGVVQHHEKHEGKGYPGRLRRDEIHDFGKIIAVADIYDALTSQRVYKKGMLPNRAMQLLYGMRGEEFAPGWAERFIKCLGIYPAGSLVRLEDGREAVVVESNPDAPLRPTVRLLTGEVLDLDDGSSQLSGVCDCLDPTEKGMDVTAFFE